MLSRSWLYLNPMLRLVTMKIPGTQHVLLPLCIFILSADAV